MLPRARPWNLLAESFDGWNSPEVLLRLCSLPLLVDHPSRTRTKEPFHQHHSKHNSPASQSNIHRNHPKYRQSSNLQSQSSRAQELLDPMSLSPSTPLSPTTPYTNAQWSLLNHYLHTPTITTTRTTPLSTLNTIDRSLLLTLLAKKSAELDLLIAEAVHLIQACKSNLEFPNYDVALARPYHSTASPTTPEATGGTGEPAQREQHHSPISPTFGPRQNAEFSGTIARRRSTALPSPSEPDSHSPTTTTTRQ